jgi:hypothetical protein
LELVPPDERLIQQKELDNFARGLFPFERYREERGLN